MIASIEAPGLNSGEVCSCSSTTSSWYTCACVLDDGGSEGAEGKGLNNIENGCWHLIHGITWQHHSHLPAAVLLGLGKGSRSVPAPFSCRVQWRESAQNAHAAGNRAPASTTVSTQPIAISCMQGLQPCYPAAPDESTDAQQQQVYPYIYAFINAMGPPLTKSSQ